MNEIENIEWNITGETLTKNEQLDLIPTTVSGIYGLRCKVTNKWYVGQSIDISNRWESYKKLRCKNQKKLYHALIKYGYDNFDTFVIESFDPIDWILDYREMYWIKYYDSVENGYNITAGGKIGINFSGLKHSDETREKMSKWQRGKKHSPERVNNMRKSLLGRKWSKKQRENIMLGKKNMSDEKKILWKTRLSNAGIGRKMPPKTPEQIKNMSEAQKRRKTYL